MKSIQMMWLVLCFVLCTGVVMGQVKQDCHPLDGPNNFLQPNETIVKAGDQYMACHDVPATPAQFQTQAPKAETKTDTPTTKVEAVVTKNVNYSGEVTNNVKADVNVNAPKSMAPVDDRPCLIVAAEEHRFNAGSGLVGLAVVAGSKGYWAFRDSYKLDPKLIQTKYKQKEVLALQQ